MRWLIVAGCMALCACTSRVERAEQQYEMVKRANAGASEVCAKGHAVAEAYLEAGNEDDYRLHKAITDGACLTARMDERNGIYHDANGNIIVADSLDANAAMLDAVATSKGDTASQDDPANACYKAGADC